MVELLARRMDSVGVRHRVPPSYVVNGALPNVLGLTCRTRVSCGGVSCKANRPGPTQLTRSGPTLR